MMSKLTRRLIKKKLNARKEKSVLKVQLMHPLIKRLKMAKNRKNLFALQDLERIVKRVRESFCTIGHR